MRNRIILFDYGGVLGRDHILKYEKILANALGLTCEEVNKRVSEKSMIGKAFRENKVTEIEFWREVSENNNIDENTASLYTKMWMDTYCLNESLMSFLQQLRKNNKVGVLTNIDIGRSRLLKEILDSNNNLDYYLPSYLFGYSKDTTQLWTLVNEKLLEDYADIDVFYIDDRIEHINSAKKIGWTCIKYLNDIQLIEQIRFLL